LATTISSTTASMAMTVCSTIKVSLTLHSFHLIHGAPRSASWRVANGAATTSCSKETTAIPSRGLLIGTHLREARAAALSPLNEKVAVHRSLPSQIAFSVLYVKVSR
jgi:hypothetical protein